MWHSMPAKVTTNQSQFHHRQQPGSHDLQLNEELHRLQTFVGWPKAEWISPAELARFGFFFIGLTDVVRCYFCLIELGGWEPYDVVVEEHLRWSRHCPLMTRRRTNNVPVDVHFLDCVPQPSCDTVGVTSERSVPETNDMQPPCSDRSISTRLPTATYNSQVLATESTINQGRPQFPSYAVAADRLKTFEDWPTAMSQRPEQLVDAGFFYTGKGDHVTCFSCGGSLKSWERDDDPWEEHAKYYGDCQYLKLLKGDGFIESCKTQATNFPVDSTSHSAPKCVESEVVEKKQDNQEVAPRSERILEDKLCKICYENEYNTVFMPCGHVVACARCASSVPRCPMCNEAYTSVFRVHLP